MIIDKEFAELIPPLSEEEYRGLEESILNEGCRDALVVWNDTLIDGHNRYKICMEHNIAFQTVRREFADRNAAMLWMIRNQLGRRNLLPYVRSDLALKLKPVIAAMAKENQRIGAEKTNTGSQKSVKAVDTQKELAKAAGVSHDTIAKVEKINAVASPEMKAELRSGNMSINQAYRQVKEAERKAERQSAIIEQLSQPKTSSHIDIYTTDKKYRVIYADPPWSYNDKQDTVYHGGAEKHYPTMPLEEICALPIPAEKDSVLFLWTTSPMLEDSFKVINAWGFRYKSSFIWDKVATAMGNYNSVRHELLLISVRGSCVPDVPKRLDSVVSIERTEHSRKPDEFRQMIDTLYPVGARLEMFARESHEGWDVWGNMA